VKVDKKETAAADKALHSVAILPQSRSCRNNPAVHVGALATSWMFPDEGILSAGCEMRCYTAFVKICVTNALDSHIIKSHLVINVQCWVFPALLRVRDLLPYNPQKIAEPQWIIKAIIIQCIKIGHLQSSCKFSSSPWVYKVPAVKQRVPA